MQGVDGERGGGDVAPGTGAGDAQVAEFGPGLDGGGEDGVAVAGGGGVGAEGVGPVFGLLYVPAAGLPAGFLEGDVDGGGEAGRVGAVVGRGAGAGGGGRHGGGQLPVGVVPLMGMTPKWARSASQERQGGA